MRYAIVDNIKSEAKRGAIGFCPNCNAELIAKCGSVKIHHWSHKGIRKCDSWWENETEWHREWKNNFPVEWQEISLIDAKTDEKHIADIRTNSGLVIEFQHSYINPVEREKRENFYENMVWVVDGTRLKRDLPRFMNGFEEDFIQTPRKGIFKVHFFEDYFPKSWIESSVPIIFDFRGMDKLNSNDIRNYLYCLFPTRNCRNALMAKFSRNAFINSVKLDNWTNRVNELLKIEEQVEQLNQLLNTRVKIRKRESKYIFEKGKWKRRRRF